MPTDRVISLDNLRTVPRVLLTDRITQLVAPRMDEVCRGLAAATNC
jgi:mRNA-degrading endonuclease toxin of MazEF toxin-antitoxin module